MFARSVFKLHIKPRSGNVELTHVLSLYDDEKVRTEVVYLVRTKILTRFVLLTNCGS